MGNVVLIVPVMIVVVMVTMHNNLAAHTASLATKGIVLVGTRRKVSSTSDNSRTPTAIITVYYVNSVTGWLCSL